jgi:diguanylate cyclase
MNEHYILVVDDDPNVRMLVKDALTLLGYETMTARTGVEALEIVRQQPPDAMILDLMMPGMTGFSVLVSLRDAAGGRNIPVIVLSALIDQTRGVERLPGVVGVMCKGNFSFDGFRHLVGKLELAA